MTNIFQTDIISHHLSNLILDLARTLDLVHTFNLAHALTHTLHCARSFALALISTSDRSFALALASTLDRSFALALDLDFDLTSTHALDLASTLDLNNIVATLNCFRAQHLGATFRDANLQGVCWDGAHLEGTLMINSQGLAPEDIADLKAKGVIFDDAPGERSPVTSPRSPVPV
ncbi:MAG: hypothetical protein O3C67_05535 [Cyanobacteria bacterium]|nr:hypothetical protein [Cyanobacteriota bacterium]